MSREPLGFSETVVRAAVVVAEHLRSRPRSSVYDLERVSGASGPTVHRSLRYLRKLGAPLVYDRSVGRHRGWLLADRNWRLPLFELTRHGFVPVTPGDST